MFAGGSRGLGTALWRVGDVALIDGAMVNGSARVVGWLSGVAAPACSRAICTTTRSR